MEFVGHGFGAYVGEIGDESILRLLFQEAIRYGPRGVQFKDRSDFTQLSDKLLFKEYSKVILRPYSDYRYTSGQPVIPFTFTALDGDRMWEDLLAPAILFENNIPFLATDEDACFLGWELTGRGITEEQEANLKRLLARLQTEGRWEGNPEKLKGI